VSRPLAPPGAPRAAAGQQASSGLSLPVIGEGASALTSAKARLARGAVSAFVVNVAGTGLAFLSQVVLARVLGASGYGIYAYVTAWGVVLALCATLGFHTAMLRFVSAYRACEEWPLLRGVLRYAAQRVSAAGLLIGAGSAGVVLALGDRLAPELARTFLVGCAIVPVLALIQVQAAVVRGFGGVISALTPHGVVRHGVLLPVIAIWGLVLAWPLAPHGAMAAMLLATLAGLGAVSWSQSRLQPAGLRSATAAFDRQTWRRTASTLLLLAVMQALLARTDLLILGMLTDPAAVGVYAVAARTSDLVAFALTAINTMFVPQIAASYAQGDRPGLQNMVTTTAWWSMISALAIALPLFVLPGFVLSLFGTAFPSGAIVLRLLLLGQVVNAATGSVGAVLTMTGYERHATAVMAVAALAQIGLSVTLIPYLGAEGAALANMTSLIGWNLAMAVLVWKKLGIVPSVLARP
jgi:O-antigen/teichoic acid export membrane protein